MQGSFLQEQDANLDCARQHQNSGEANIQVSKWRVAPVEHPVEFFASSLMHPRPETVELWSLFKVVIKLDFAGPPRGKNVPD